MVGIVGILLLGSLAWSAVGALFSALGEATSSISTSRPTPTRLTALVGTATPPPAVTSSTQAATPGPRGTAAPLTTTPATSSPAETPAVSAPTPTPQAGAATPTPSGRAPWILLPQPAPDSRVTSGPVVIEARGRGDAAISAIRLDLDGVPLAVSLEQRSETTWRGFANTKVASGHHAVRATVVDEEGRSGGFRWTFEDAPCNQKSEVRRPNSTIRR